MKYSVNQGKRDFAIRMGCEAGVYQFVHDYATEMGMSASGALRRLALIGARCEAEHGNATMPGSYYGLRTGSKEFDTDPFEEFK